MDIKRRLVLLVPAVCVSSCLGLSSAAASTEVFNEATGVPCTAVTEVIGGVPEVSGGCPARAVANDIEAGGAFGAMAVCDLTFEGRISGGGLFVASTYTIADCLQEGSFNGTPCTGNGDRHPRIQMVETAGFPSGPFPTTSTFCVVAFAGLVNRCVDVAATTSELTGHNYSVSFLHTNKCANAINSLQGTITFVSDAAHPKFEIR
jgi:hypothetical protein